MLWGCVGDGLWGVMWGSQRRCVVKEGSLAVVPLGLLTLPVLLSLPQDSVAPRRLCAARFGPDGPPAPGPGPP